MSEYTIIGVIGAVGLAIDAAIPIIGYCIEAWRKRRQRMNHEASRTHVYEDGSEIWYCARCGFSVIVRWSPGGGNIPETHILNAGNDKPHDGICYADPEPLNFGGEWISPYDPDPTAVDLSEPFVPVDDLTLVLFAEWGKGLEDWGKEGEA